jgi:putative ABC transport system permease protein
MLRATLKDLWARKIRLFTTSAAVVLGVAFMAGTLVLTDTIGKTFDDLFSDVNESTDALVRAKATIEQSSFDGGDQRPRIDDSIVSAVRGVDGVEFARGEILGYAQIVGRDGKAIGNPSQGPPTFGGVWNDDELNPYTLREGRAPELQDEAVIDRLSAKDGDLHVGDRTQILTPDPVDVTIVGIVTFGSADSPGGASFVGMTEAAAQQLFAEPGKFDGVGVIAEDGVSQTELRARIADAMPNGIEVITGEELTKENRDSIGGFVGFIKNILLTFASIALFVGSFIIYNTFGIIVAQRTRELALLRALGASRRQVLRSVLVEATAVGFLSSGIGLLLGIGIASLLKALMDSGGFDVPAGSIVVTPGTIITSFVVGLLVTVSSAYFPARKAAKIPPLAAMRDVAYDKTNASRGRLITGALVTVLGAAMLLIGLFGEGGIAPVGFGALLTMSGVIILGPVLAPPIGRVLGAPLPRLKGTTGVLAKENTLRNPKRTASTAAALMIGVALVGFITVFASSAKASINKVVDDQFVADIIIDSGSFGDGGLSPRLADDLRSLPEVAAATGLRGAPANVNGGGSFLLAVDTATLAQFFDLGVTEGAIADVGADGIGVNEDWAADHHLQLGDTVDVQMLDGAVEHLPVRVLYTDQVLAGSYFVGTPFLEAHQPDQYDFNVFVLGKDGVDPDDLRVAVEEAAKTYPTAKVQDINDFKEAQAAQFNVLLVMIYALLFFSILIALLGIMNTLALSVHERTRELGLVRAIGMSRRQVRSTIRWESILIALLGTVLGIAVGLFFGWAMATKMKDVGFNTFSVPIVQLAVICVLAALAGVFAAIWPARRASRLDILAAIASE